VKRAIQLDRYLRYLVKPGLTLALFYIHICTNDLLSAAVKK